MLNFRSDSNSLKVEIIFDQTRSGGSELAFHFCGQVPKQKPPQGRISISSFIFLKHVIHSMNLSKWTSNQSAKLSK